MQQLVTANPDGWTAAQEYELTFWRDHWVYKDQSIDWLQSHRHAVATWFLKEMGFAQTSEHAFHGFEGNVLEVGCGPIGFFELMEGVDVTAQDTLMRAYADNIAFSTLGARGSVTYVPLPVHEIPDTFDFVVCSNVLDHTGDWIDFLQQCRARIVPGGELLLYTDSRGAPEPGHTQIFSPQQLSAVLKLLGAKHITAKTDISDDGHSDFKNFVRAKF